MDKANNAFPSWFSLTGCQISLSVFLGGPISSNPFALTS